MLNILEGGLRMAGIGGYLGVNNLILFLLLLILVGDCLCYN